MESGIEDPVTSGSHGCDAGRLHLLLKSPRNRFMNDRATQGFGTQAGLPGRQRLRKLALLGALALATVLPPALKAGAAETIPAPNASGPVVSLPADVATDVVTQRLMDSLSPELRDNFGLFIYVDKAERGPLAQHMYVFEKTEGGNLALLHDWPVSTGRERIERDAHGHVEYSGTPLGFFELDPKRFFIDHDSSQWDEAMPYAMFFNWKPNGRKTGLAIHGTSDENSGELGSPASAGCIRLSLDDARTLFDLIQTRSRGPIPKLAYLDGDSGVSSEGLLEHDSDGRLRMIDGYSVLVLVDNFGGEQRISSL